MRGTDVLRGALALLGDAPASAEAGYEDRAAAMLGMVYQSLLPPDRILKRHRGKAPVLITDFSLPLDSDPGIEDDFFACACHLLASELTAFEDSDLSAALFVRGEALKRLVAESIPFEVKRL